MELKKEDGRIYAEGADGVILAEVNFPATDGMAVINHTYVHPSLRGSGMAGKLVEEAVKKIREDGNAVAATCSYAAAWLERHPEIETADCGHPVSCRIRKH